MNKASLKEVIGTLEMLFSKFNKKFFDNKLENPVITVTPDKGKKGMTTWGWCTSWKAWKDSDDGGYYEINLCAEYLTRPFELTCGTLIHEMCHLYNLQNGIKDCSRGGTYHNAKFKEAAIAHGLTCEKTNRGWTKTGLTEETAAWIQSEFDEKSRLGLYREKLMQFDAVGTAKKSSTRKYVCPVCGTIIRATKEVNVTCTDCNENFLLAE